MVDYLIIGSGLAGISFAEQVLQNNKSIYVIDTNLQNSSKIAGGLYNPVILKRFSKLNDAQNQLNLLHEFFVKIESKLETKLDFKLPVLRKFFSVEEQNNWFVASDKEGLSPFLSTKLVSKKYKCIDSPYDFGEVLQTGYVDVALLVEKYKKFLVDNKLFLDESFDYNFLIPHPDFIQYKDIKAKQIIFAEGFGLQHNPFFNYLPLDGTKGELLVIKAPKLDLDVIVNASVFILPLGNDIFKVGATYNWEDKTCVPTEEGKKELVDKLKEIINCNFEIISHLAGVRPTVKDRQPLIGKHPIYSQLYILNGLGTRGVLLAPAMAKTLFEYIEYSIPLDLSIDIKRFDKKKNYFFKSKLRS